MTKLRKLSAVFLLCIGAVACTDLSPVESRLDDIESRLDKIDEIVGNVNNVSASVSKLMKNSVLITSYQRKDFGYTLSLGDGSVIDVVYGLEAPGIVPMIGVDNDGNWIMSVDSGKTFQIVKKSVSSDAGAGATPKVRVDEEGYWNISLDGGKTWTRILNGDSEPISAVDGMKVAHRYPFFSLVDLDESGSTMHFVLADGNSFSIPVVTDFYVRATGFGERQTIHRSEMLCFEVRISDVAECAFEVPEGWKAKLTADQITFTAPAEAAAGEYVVKLLCVSGTGLLKTETFKFDFSLADPDKTDCKPWNDFVAGNADNVLLDFAYAGYDHGQSLPPDVWTLGYKVYNVCDYGAIPNDGKSDRLAYLNCLQAALGTGATSRAGEIVFGEVQKANAIIYFPEGEYNLMTEDDYYTDGTAQMIFVRSGNIVLKGAGRDKTRIVMDACGYPGEAALSDGKLWAGIPMLQFGSWSGTLDYSPAVVATGAAAKGDFSVTVNSTAGVKKGDWITISALVTAPEYIDKELYPHKASEAPSLEVATMGVNIQDMHQVASVEGNTITFCEPIMHEIDPKYEFAIKKFQHYENVGVEDITFAAKTEPDYEHHKTWKYDSGWSIIVLKRCVNSWVRRVDFDSVTEGFTFTICANCSGYDMECYGTRGHHFIRSANSSRVFIGATYDHSDGVVNDGNNGAYASRSMLVGAGQLHGQGVSGTNMGAVLWRNVWGKDACFEAHAAQPRASLFDCCKGGWMSYRVGGAITMGPNHLDDLIIWNMNATNSNPTMKWWMAGESSMKVLPPTIVGFHGSSYSPAAGDVKMNYSNGTAVLPESLYEAQMRRRFGYVPAWLQSLKSIAKN